MAARRPTAAAWRRQPPRVVTPLCDVAEGSCAGRRLAEPLRQRGTDAGKRRDEPVAAVLLEKHTCKHTAQPARVPNACGSRAVSVCVPASLSCSRRLLLHKRHCPDLRTSPPQEALGDKTAPRRCVPGCLVGCVCPSLLFSLSLGLEGLKVTR